MYSSRSFEEEILSLNPDHDLIFGSTQSTKPALPPHRLELDENDCLPRNIALISRMNELTGDRPVGELPADSQLLEKDNIESQTVAMMRKLGLGASTDGLLDERRTIATLPIDEDMIHMRNGPRKMPIFMGDKYFKLNPSCSEPSFDFDESINAHEPVVDPSASTSSNPTASSEIFTSFDTTTDQRIEYLYDALDSTNKTDSTDLSLSETNFPQLTPNTKSKTITRKKYAGKPKEGPMQSWRCQSIDPERIHFINSTSNSKKPVNEAGSWRRESAIQDAKSNSVNSWRRSADNPDDVKDESPNAAKNSKENKKAERPRTSREKPIEPVAVSTCGSLLYKPKDLALKKKARLIRKVFSDSQS